MHTCKHCFYSRALGALESGGLNANGEQAFICRRFPPTPIPIMGRAPLTNEPIVSIQAVHPPVRGDDYCGEFIANKMEVQSP